MTGIVMIKKCIKWRKSLFVLDDNLVEYSHRHQEAVVSGYNGYVKG